MHFAQKFNLVIEGVVFYSPIASNEIWCNFLAVFFKANPLIIFAYAWEFLRLLFLKPDPLAKSLFSNDVPLEKATFLKKRMPLEEITFYHLSAASISDKCFDRLSLLNMVVYFIQFCFWTVFDVSEILRFIRILLENRSKGLPGIFKHKRF